MDSSKPAEAVKNAVKTASDKIADALTPDVPGAPGSAPPPVEEPTTPRDPLPPKTEQGAPQTRTPTGAETGAPTTAKGQQGAFLTTSQGARLRDTDHSLKAGSRGPTLLQDHHLRERSRISTTSAFPSAWCTRAARERTASSPPTAPRSG